MENWKYPQFVGEKAVDGDETTRWSADKQDEQWLIVDLGEVKHWRTRFTVACRKSCV